MEPSTFHRSLVAIPQSGTVLYVLYDRLKQLSCLSSKPSFCVRRTTAVTLLYYVRMDVYSQSVQCFNGTNNTDSDLVLGILYKRNDIETKL